MTVIDVVTVTMRGLSGDHLGIGGVGVLMLVVVLLVLAVVGGGVLHPMLIKQSVNAGDQLVYSVDGNIAGMDGEGEWIYTFTTIGSDEATVNFNDGNISTDHTVSLDHDGTALLIDDAPFLSPFWFMSLVRDNATDFEKTMEYGLLGLTPMAFDVYSGEAEFLGETVELVVKTKMGTELPLLIDLSRADDYIRMELTDTSMNWISYQWGLL